MGRRGGGAILHHRPQRGKTTSSCRGKGGGLGAGQELQTDADQKGASGAGPRALSSVLKAQGRACELDVPEPWDSDLQFLTISAEPGILGWGER